MVGNWDVRWYPKTGRFSRTAIFRPWRCSMWLVASRFLFESFTRIFECLRLAQEQFHVECWSCASANKSIVCASPVWSSISWNKAIAWRDLPGFRTAPFSGGFPTKHYRLSVGGETPPPYGHTQVHLGKMGCAWHHAVNFYHSRACRSPTGVEFCSSTEANQNGCAKRLLAAVPIQSQLLP